MTARNNKTQPSEANVNDEVAIRLMIGVIPAQSKPNPSTRQIADQISSFFTLSVPDNNNFPASAPAMVCTAVGIQLIATQPPSLMMFIIFKST